MRAHGARVGLGEVLAAQRALAAVDAADRTEVFFALRAALCSTRAELTAFAAAFTAVFGADEPRDPLDELGEIAKQALPRVAVPPQGDEAPAADLTPAPAAWSEEELLREKDFAAYTDAERAVARRLLRADRAARADAALAPHRPDQAPARRARPARDRPRLAAPRRRAARAPLPRAGRAAAAARADLRRVRLDGAVLAHAAAVHAGLRRRARAGRGVRVRHAAHARDPRAARARLRPGAGARRRAPSTTGRAARGSARRSPSSTASTAAGSAAARW